MCGKIVVATNDLELKRMDELEANGRLNGIEIERLDQAELRRREPNVTGLGGLFVGTTGIVDYKQVCTAMAEQDRRGRWHDPDGNGGRDDFGAARRGDRRRRREKLALPASGRVRRPAVRPAGAVGGPEDRASDRAVPRRVLRLEAGEGRHREQHDLSGARPRTALHSAYI